MVYGSLTNIINEEKNYVKVGLRQALAVGAQFSCISIPWLNKWKEYAGYDAVGPHQIDESLHPGEIDNSNLVGAHEKELKKGLVEGVDFILLPMHIYNKLREHYKGGPDFVRSIIDNGNNCLQAELYPVRLEIRYCVKSMYPDPAVPPRHWFASKLCNLGIVQKDVAGAQRLSTHSVRSWIEMGNNASTSTGPPSNNENSDDQEDDSRKMVVDLSDEADTDGKILSQTTADVVKNGLSNNSTSVSGGRRLTAEVTDVAGDWMMIRNPSNASVIDLLGDKPFLNMIVEACNYGIHSDDGFPRNALITKWKNELRVGDILDVEDRHCHWFESRVEEIADTGDIRVHFLGWGKKLDEVISPAAQRVKFAPLYTKTQNWRAKIDEDDVIEYRVLVPRPAAEKKKKAGQGADDEDDDFTTEGVNGATKKTAGGGEVDDDEEPLHCWVTAVVQDVNRATNTVELVYKTEDKDKQVAATLSKLNPTATASTAGGSSSGRHLPAAITSTSGYHGSSHMSYTVRNNLASVSDSRTRSISDIDTEDAFNIHPVTAPVAPAAAAVTDETKKVGDDENQTGDDVVPEETAPAEIRVTVDLFGEDICKLYTHTKQPSVNNGYHRSTSMTSSFNNNYDEWGEKSIVGKPLAQGVVGLQNLGNTCFMNSILQCLSNTSVLTEFFTSNKYKLQLNSDNPLGHQGKLAQAYAKLMKEMWCNNYSKVVPRSFKKTIGDFQPQFAGYQQQDSQELMGFLLDGLHEDLNRIKQKPAVSKIESHGRPDELIAKEAWRRFLLRNDSELVDHFYGQLKSHVTCTNCGRESVTFDPFNTLSLPVPVKTTRPMTIFVQLLPLGSIPFNVDIEAEVDDTIGDLKSRVIQRLMECHYLPRQLKNMTRVPIATAALNALNTSNSLKRKGTSSTSTSSNGCTTLVQELEKDILSDNDDTTDYFSLQDRRDDKKPTTTHRSSNNNEMYDDETVRMDDEAGDDKDDDADSNNPVVPYSKTDFIRRTKALLEYTNNINDTNNNTKNTNAANENTVPINFVAMASYDNEKFRFFKDLSDSTPFGDLTRLREKVSFYQLDYPVASKPSYTSSMYDSVARSGGSEFNFVTYLDIYFGSLKKEMRGMSPILDGRPNRVNVTKETTFAQLFNLIDKIVERFIPSTSTYYGYATKNNNNTDAGDNANNKTNKGSGNTGEDSPADDNNNNNNNNSIRPYTLFLTNTFGQTLRQFNIPDLNAPLNINLTTNSDVIYVAWNSDLYTNADNFSTQEYKRFHWLQPEDDDSDDVEDYVIEDDNDSNAIHVGEDEKRKKLLGAAPKAGDNTEEAVKKKPRSNSKHGAPGKLSVYKCLDKFVEREQLDEAETLYCPRCKQHLAPVKKMDIWAAPDVLVLHLKRFQYIPGSYFIHREKISDLIDFPIDGLDLTDYVKGTINEPSIKPIYDLFAVSHHSGGLGGGHYTAVCKNPINNEWYNFNDSFVSKTNPSSAVSEMSYVLFYKRSEGTCKWAGMVPLEQGIPDEE